jgi:predicted Fe-Mo cluster-binding NifX family protein
VVAELAGDQVVSSRSVASTGHGEGSNMPRFVQGLGVGSVIVGGIGGGAVNGLAARGIEVIAGVVGDVGDVLRYAAGRLICGEPGCHGHGVSDHGCGHHHH